MCIYKYKKTEIFHQFCISFYISFAYLARALCLPCASYLKNRQYRIKAQNTKIAKPKIFENRKESNRAKVRMEKV